VINAASQTPDWIWAKSMGGQYEENVTRTLSDEAGNIYLAGAFTTPMLIIGSDTLIHINSLDIFIIKCNNDGEILWARCAGGSGNEFVHAITADSSGNIYLTGSYYSPSLYIGSDTLLNHGAGEIFLIKYNSDGDLIWTKSIGGNDSDVGDFISTDSEGNVILAGHFQSPVIYFDSDSITNSGSRNILIIKYDAEGNCIWVKYGAGECKATITSFISDVAGNIYIAGNFSSNGIILGTDTLTSKGFTDIFLSKIDSNGNFLWTKSAGGDDIDHVNCIDIDDAGNIYISGDYSGISIIFEADTLTNDSAYYQDIFLSRYDNYGNFNWAVSLGGTGGDYPYCIDLDNSGSIYLAGTFRSPIISSGSSFVVNSGAYDVFLAKYSNIGDLLWMKSIGGSNDESCSAVKTDNSGDVYISGLYEGPYITFGSDTLTCAGYSDIYFLKYDANGIISMKKSLGGEGFESVRPILFDNSGNIFFAGSFESQNLIIGIDTLTNNGDRDIFLAKFGLNNSVNVIRTSDDVLVYPNPATRTIYISILENKTELKYISIFNMIGQQLSNIDSQNQNTLKVDISNLVKGTYIVKIQTSNIFVIKKLIVN
jgi:hypothetical protein